MPIHDVVIVGAGPGGAYLAYLLAARGLSVALLEKERLPRYKVCGGGVTLKAAQLVDFDLSATFERTPRVGVITLRGRKTLEVRWEAPIAWTVMRDRFDTAIVERAVARGARLYEGRRVGEVSGDEVRAGGEVFRGRIVVGADGVLSRVAASAGLRTGRRTAVAVECEVAVDGETLDHFADRALFDFGGSPHGYGWVFPKRDHLSVGVCTVREEAGLLGTHVDWMLQAYCPKGTLLRRRGHLLPLFTGPEALSHGRTILLGDAAGLVDPFTGEGIYHALKSAALAAPVVEQAISNGAEDLAAYDRVVWESVGTDLSYAGRIGRVFFGRQDLLYDVVLRNRFFAEGFIGVLTGQTTYRQFVSSSLRHPLAIVRGYHRR